MPEPYNHPYAWIVTALCAGAIFVYLFFVLPRR
jgi:hypothetical protein